MMQLTNVTDLANAAIKIDRPITVFNPTQGGSRLFNFKPSWNQNYGFNIEGGVISFVLGKTFYTIPNTFRIMKILIDDGFTREESIPVPFANGTGCREYGMQWHTLVRQAKAA